VSGSNALDEERLRTPRYGFSGCLRVGRFPGCILFAALAYRKGSREHYSASCRLLLSGPRAPNPALQRTHCGSPLNANVRLLKHGPHIMLRVSRVLITCCFVGAAACVHVNERKVCTQPISEVEPHSYWIQPLLTDKLVYARVPQGRFVLLRHEQTVQAIRFTAVAGSPTEGTQTGCARYELFDITPGHTIRSCIGTVSTFATRGSHLTAYNPGNSRFACGAIWAIYFFPTQLWVTAPSEVALTRWSQPDQLNPLDPELTWYEYRSGTANGDAIHLTPQHLPE
jgi:hypothetical protein